MAGNTLILFFTVGCTTAVLSLYFDWTLRDCISRMLVAFTAKHSRICLAYVCKVITALSVTGDGLGDQMLCIWDLAKPVQPVSQINAHQSEVLACDWSKYEEVSGGTTHVLLSI